MPRPLSRFFLVDAFGDTCVLLCDAHMRRAHVLSLALASPSQSVPFCLIYACIIDHITDRPCLVFMTHTCHSITWFTCDAISPDATTRGRRRWKRWERRLCRSWDRRRCSLRLSGDMFLMMKRFSRSDFGNEILCDIMLRFIVWRVPGFYLPTLQSTIV